MLIRIQNIKILSRKIDLYALFAKRMPFGHEKKQIQKSAKSMPYEMFSMKLFKDSGIN